jgi:hypothetical protein
METICTNCGGIGHTEEICPSKPQENKNYAIWIKLDNASESECNGFLKGVIDVKQKCAPKARATYAKAPKNELPMRIKEALALEDKKLDGEAE